MRINMAQWNYLRTLGQVLSTFGENLHNVLPWM